MKNLVFSTIVSLGALGAPHMVSAAEQSAPLVMAQVDVRVGPNGVRIGDDRDRYRDDRRYERRREFDRDGGFREGRGYGRHERCRTTIVQRETPYGMRTRPIRECG